MTLSEKLSSHTRKKRVSTSKLVFSLIFTLSFSYAHSNLLATLKGYRNAKHILCGKEQGTMYVSAIIIAIFTFSLSSAFYYDSIFSSSPILSFESALSSYNSDESASEAFAQPDLNVVRHRNLTINLGNRVSATFN